MPFYPKSALPIIPLRRRIVYHPPTPPGSPVLCDREMCQQESYKSTHGINHSRTLNVLGKFSILQTRAWTGRGVLDQDERFVSRRDIINMFDIARQRLPRPKTHDHCHFHFLPARRGSFSENIQPPSPTFPRSEWERRLAVSEWERRIAVLYDTSYDMSTLRRRLKIISQLLLHLRGQCLEHFFYIHPPIFPGKKLAIHAAPTAPLFTKENV